MATDSPQRLPWEENFRQQVRKRREEMGLSQSELAKRIRAKGPAFHQQTVARIESGERPVRLDEAYLIAQELNEGLDYLVVPLNWQDQAVSQGAARIFESGRKIHQGFTEWIEAQEQLAEIADHGGLSDHWAETVRLNLEASPEELMGSARISFTERYVSMLEPGDPKTPFRNRLYAAWRLLGDQAATQRHPQPERGASDEALDESQDGKHPEAS